MALEKKWNVVPPRLFVADGNAFGLITLVDTAGFKGKQEAYLLDNLGNSLAVQVKRVISPTQLVVGLIDNKMASWKPLNLSNWTVANGASIGAQEQDKNRIPPDDHQAAIYEADPTVADRVVFVDQYGNFYDEDNPLPINFSGSITIGAVEVKGTNGNTIEPNPDGSLNVVIESIPSPNANVKSTYNEVLAVPPGATTVIVSYTVPTMKQAVLQRAPFSGENVARFDLLINNVVQDTARLYFGGDYTGSFDFTSGNDSGLLLNAGDIVKIQVLHNRPDTGAFEARIQVLEISL